MATKVASDPTQNLFALLGDDATEAPAAAKKETKAKKPAAAAASAGPVGSGPAALTPAEKAAKAREKAAKNPKPASEQRAPRRDAPAADERLSGPRGSGNRGAQRSVNAQPHGHVPPAHGRPFDKQSQSTVPRKPQTKKGGAGKGNWGKDVKDSVIDQDTAAAVDGWGDAANKPAVEDKKEETTEATEAAEAAPAAPAEPEDKSLTLDEYLKQREEAAKALAAKVGVVQARKVENADLTGAVESKRVADPAAAAAPAAAKTEAAGSRKGTKTVNVADVLNVRVAPAGDRAEGGRGRGRGRGRGEGRGGRGGDRAPRGDRPPRAADGDRAPRGEARGAARGAARGGAERGAARGGRGRPLDTTNNRQFPSLGQ